MITDDAVRERHGVSCRQQDTIASAITVFEGEEVIYLNSCAYTRNMTSWQARYLASKLYRLSRRVRQRGEAS